MQLNVIFILLHLLSVKDMILWMPAWVIVNFQSIVNAFVLHQVMYATEVWEDERRITSQDPELAILFAITKGKIELHQGLQKLQALC